MSQYKPMTDTTKKRSASASGPSLGAAPEPTSKRTKLAESTNNARAEDIIAMKLQNEAEQKLWPRPPLAEPLNPARHSVVFQQMECDYTIVTHPKSEMAKVCGSKEDKIPIVRLFGVTEQGQSVYAHVYGFMPYFYAPVPVEYKNVDDVTACNDMKNCLNQRLMVEVNQHYLQVKNYVLAVEIVHKESIMRFHNNQKSPFFRITLALPKHVPNARRILESGIMLKLAGSRSMQTYESNIQFALRFMVDADMTGSCWVEIPPTKYILTREPESTCQIEIDVLWEDIISHKPEGEWMKTAPLRILSFDIECAAKEGFPKPEADPIIQIANMVTLQGQPKPFLHNVFVLRGCTPIVGNDVRCFKTEHELLMAWRDFVVQVDPDVIIGYNILNFDLPYIWDRAKELRLKDFSIMSRLRNEPVQIKTTKFSSKAYGTKESHEMTMTGRVFFDLLQAIQREYKLRSYTLNSVSTEFLGEQKEDVHHSIISKLFDGSDDDRRRLASYCLKDAYLPQRLMDKLLLLLSYMEMARVTGVPFSYLLSRGQSIKVLSQLYRRANVEGLILPTYQKSKEDATDEVAYEGAVVIEPMRAFYEVPIATLDFASLYPSIMMAHNLCYSTLINKQVADTMAPEEFTHTPAGNYFVKSTKRKGVLPQILEDLISARNRVKKEMGQEKDKFKKELLNCRQLALKISANSVYGFTGATIGSLPCLEISASVTAFGREMINKTREVVLAEYAVKNGYKWDAEVIYGDTDSVMVKFGADNLEESMKLGREAAKFVTTKFIKPIQLEFEKCYYPYLLISKKRYAGLLWTKPEKFDKLDAKGIETVRRDNCLLVKHVVSTCLNKILIERDIEGAKTFCKQIISELLQNNLDISLLVITKAMSKTDYKAKQAHVELNEKLKKRGEGYHIGDRVAYVILAGAQGTNISERAEDPIFALENNSQLDANYYMEMLKRPLVRIFKPVTKNAEAELMHGEHTLKRKFATPKKGGIVGFAQVTATCPGCKGPVKAGDPLPCAECQADGKSPALYAQQLSVVKRKEREFGRLWTQCQACQGSFHQEVLCTARDCNIFYLRSKVQMDLNEARTNLEKFNAGDVCW